MASLFDLTTHDGFRGFLTQMFEGSTDELDDFLAAYFAEGFIMRSEGLIRDRDAGEAWMRDVKPLCKYRLIDVPWYTCSPEGLLACQYVVTYTELEPGHRQILGENFMMGQLDAHGKLLVLNKTERVMGDAEPLWRPPLSPEPAAKPARRQQLASPAESVPSARHPSVA